MNDDSLVAQNNTKHFPSKFWIVSTVVLLITNLLTLTGYILYPHQSLPQEHVTSLPVAMVTASPTPGVRTILEVVALPEKKQIPSDWLTYTGKKSPFSLRYPSNFKVNEVLVNQGPNSGQPSVTITDPSSNLELLLDPKLEFGITELGLFPNLHSAVSSQPHLIRQVNAFNEEWIYYERTPGGKCVNEKTGNTVTDGEGGLICYDVNFPFNWSYQLSSVTHTPFTADQVPVFSTFDQIILSISLNLY